ncbi:hypothetical protein BCR33DRAFT_724096 [Rhizoclosmatium globosum]|uniref:Uncharacterized protein n=1 Tax=Rhizoclosmatium globosum TaxID=329046 RepID=A0A1Y2B8M3_9FUNG|nr:hypothetical protein BCR33DRAFT_724096 [Rhizoclosmatium globosum]|eukprot:ORY31163.1 hypothetical protein BCR33DRAFT_724096 [Rhizoclosmatium globosum]
MPVQYRKNTLTPLSVLSDVTTVPFAINTTKAIFKLWSAVKSSKTANGKRKFPLCIECRETLFLKAPSPTEDLSMTKEESISSALTIVQHNEITAVKFHGHSESEECACCANLTTQVLEIHEDSHEHNMNVIHEEESESSCQSESTSEFTPSLHKSDVKSDAVEQTPTASISEDKQPASIVELCEEVVIVEEVVTQNKVPVVVEETELQSPVPVVDEIQQVTQQVEHESITSDTRAELENPSSGIETGPPATLIIETSLPATLKETASTPTPTSSIQSSPVLHPEIINAYVPPLPQQSSQSAPVSDLKRKPSFLKRKVSNAHIKAAAWWNKVQAKFHKDKQ